MINIPKRLTIDEMQVIAKDRGGICLSNTYVNSTTKLEWECAKGHRWWSTPSDVKGGYWCATCGGNKKLTIEEMQEMAKQRGGKCLSTEYQNNKTHLLWACDKGHQWWSKPLKVFAFGHWCPECGGTNKRTIEEMRQIAESRGGKCLSLEYVNSGTKLLWLCANGHTWEAVPYAVKAGSWCPHCTYNLNEEKTRYVFETSFNQKFKRNRTVLGDKLELDGYNSTLKLAFEYNGIQHYEYSPGFHSNKEAFEKQKLRDEEKRRRCIEKYIKLITIPYWVSDNDVELIKFIKNELKKENIAIHSNSHLSSLDEFYKNTSILEEFRRLAKSRGGECLSTTFYNQRSKLIWKCAEGHVWEATPQNVKNGQWCRACSGSLKLTIEQMQELARLRRGECLSTEYIDKETKLQWRCAKGHTWWATPGSVKNAGSWCKTCQNKLGSKKRRVNMGIDDEERFKEVVDIANSKGGKCLSEKYTRANKKLKFVCKNGHEWETTYRQIIKGCWCEICIKKENGEKRRIGLEFFQQYAFEKGGECLSTEYINKDEKLTFKCKEGHIFSIRGGSIKNRGSWCKTCSGFSEKKL